MAQDTPLITVTCPCCQAELHIDPETRAVIRYVEHVKPPTFADLESAVQRQRGEASRREDAFLKSVESHKDASRRAEQEIRRNAQDRERESGRAAAQARY